MNKFKKLFIDFNVQRVILVYYNYNTNEYTLYKKARDKFAQKDKYVGTYPAKHEALELFENFSLKLEKPDNYVDFHPKKGYSYILNSKR